MQNVFIPMPKVFVSNTINVFVFYLEGLENHEKQHNYKKKICKTSLPLGMDLQKG